MFQVFCDEEYGYEEAVVNVLGSDLPTFLEYCEGLTQDWFSIKGLFRSFAEEAGAEVVFLGVECTFGDRCERWVIKKEFAHLDDQSNIDDHPERYQPLTKNSVDASCHLHNRSDSWIEHGENTFRFDGG